MPSNRTSGAGDLPLFDQIGGAPAVAAVVNRFYDAVLDDPDLAPHFHDVDMDRLRVHQKAFIAAALGGPHAYNGRLSRAHADLGITDLAFDRVVGHLLVALDDCGVPADVAASVAERLAPLRDQVVQR